MKFFSLEQGLGVIVSFLFSFVRVFQREEEEEEETHLSLFFSLFDLDRDQIFEIKKKTQVGLLILVYGFYRKMLLTIAVGVWMLFSTFELLAFVVKGKASDHPLFCFEDSNDDGQVGGVEGGGAAAAAPPPPPAAQPASQWSFAPRQPAPPAAPVPANPFASSTEMTRPNI